MLRFRSFAALSAALILLFSSTVADGAGSDAFEADDIDLPFEELIPSLSGDENNNEETGTDVFTPSSGSPWDHDLGSSYWTTPMDITDTGRVWNMLMEPITVTHHRGGYRFRKKAEQIPADQAESVYV